MAATAERQQLTGVLLDGIQRTHFATEAQLDRIERLISTREELEGYIAILMQKTQGKAFLDRHLLDRLERLLSIHQRLDEEPSEER